MADQTPDAPKPDTASDGTTADKDTTILTAGGTTDPAAALPDAGPPKLPHAWMGGLTAAQKADKDLVEALSKFEKGIPDLARSYVELGKKLGQAVVPPNEKASDEEKARYREAIGVPEKPGDYKLEELKLPDGIEIDKAMQAEFLKKAHEAGLTNAQANALYSWYTPELANQIANTQRIVKTTMEEAAAAVRKRHGVDAEAATGYMERGFKHFATPGLASLFKTTGLGNHPEIVDLFVGVGKLVSEHKFVDGSRGLRQEPAGEFGRRTDAEIAATMYPSSQSN